jgi:hypothetical protein
MKGWDIYKDPKWILDNLSKRYRVIRVPTNGGWYISNAGSGGISQFPFYLIAYTGTTANSRGLCYAYAFGLNSGDIYIFYLDWTKYLEIEFTVGRTTSDPEVIARVQLKEANTEGALAQRGIGIEIDNYAIIGESYGTTRGTVNLGSLTDGRISTVRIVKTTSSVEFWINNVLAGAITDSSAIPNVKGTANCFMVISIINGSTGGVSATLYISNIRIIQNR